MRVLKQIAFTLFLGLILSSCAIFSSDVYMAYYWDDDLYTLQVLEDDNPDAPDVLGNNNYFLSRPGTYSGSYTLSGSSWDFKYKLWVDYPISLLDDVQDGYFQLWLRTDGPLFLDRTFDVEEKSIDPILDTTSEAPSKGVIYASHNGYHIQLEYWKSEE